MDHTTKAPEGGPQLLKIGDFARLAGTNLRTLRYYEEIGLIEPTSRSQGGFRYYRETDVNRLNMIRDLQDLGLPLDSIRQLMDTRAPSLSRASQMDRIGKALEQQDQLLAVRMAALGEQRERLQRAQNKLVECTACLVVPSASNNYCEPCSVCNDPLPRDLSALF
jgi:DNA-binding transcriptional MerR regulator